MLNRCILRPLTEPRKTRCWPGKVRTFNQVPDHVWRDMRDCCQGRSPWPLVLFGDAGSGKTCAGLWMTDVFGGQYYTLAAWANRLRAADKGELYVRGEYAECRLYIKDVWGELRRTRLFVLDELDGRSDESDYRCEVLLHTLDGREGKPAVFISNRPLADLDAIHSEPVSSRLSGGTIVELKGDRRRARRV